MAAQTPRLVMRRAPLPYFRPFVILNQDTNEVIGHYKTEQQAKADLKLFLAGVKVIKASAIQPTRDAFKAQDTRMAHPFGEKPAEIVRKPGQLGRRAIEL